MDCSLSYILPGHRLTLAGTCAIFLNKHNNAQTIALPIIPTPRQVAELRPRQLDAHIRAYRRWTRQETGRLRQEAWQQEELALREQEEAWALAQQQKRTRLKME